MKLGEENAKHYYFVTRYEMKNEIQHNHFIEHGEYNGHFYGLSINTVRDVMNQGKVCLLVLAPRVSTRSFLTTNNSKHITYAYTRPATGAEIPA